MSQRQVEQLSYAGIDEVTLVHALYIATMAIGMGRIHDQGPSVPLEQIRVELERLKTVEHWRSSVWAGDSLRIDYFLGRPFKIELDTKEKILYDTREYNMNAREPAAAIIERLLVERSVRLARTLTP